MRMSAPSRNGEGQEHGGDDARDPDEVDRPGQVERDDPRAVADEVAVIASRGTRALS